MMSGSHANLDLACAQLGAELAKKSDEKTLTDALSVLEEQGVYAFFLFLKQKKERSDLSKACREFLPKQFGRDFDGNDEFRGTQALAKDLDKLFFARDLLRQALVYGRYHAKAASQRRTER
ncbi:MAG: hypothetical protein KatS3mg102_2217 [Planctomycetota bacterium]|nr:MAG: hypothetical protein KatS3mg102_2217 [Planctomycetota bacterium]